VHSIYETTMIGRHGRDLIEMIPQAETDPVAPVGGNSPTGRDAAVAVVALMQRTVRRLAPLTIVDLFDSHMGRGQVDVLWDKLKEPTAACMQDGAKTLARVWEAAWRAAKAENGAAGGKFDQDDLQKLYNTPSFLPAFKLQDVELDAAGRIVSKAGGRGDPQALAAGDAAVARRPRQPAAAAKAARRKAPAKRKRARG
jgi:hypothetical protein